MNIISQNCLAGNIYKHSLQKQYPNPFIWTVIDYNSMFYLIENWNKINFNNYELVKDKGWKFSIIIEKKIKIQYVHCKFEPKIDGIKKIGPDIYSNKIWEFIVKCYEDRLTRMLNRKEEPIFLICNHLTIFKDAVYTKEQLKTLKNRKNVLVIEGFENCHPLKTSIDVYNKFLKEKE